METNEVMIEEITEEVIKNEGHGLKGRVAGLGIAIVLGGLTYKYVVKPMLDKRKKAKEDEENFKPVEDEDCDESAEDEVDIDEE